MAYNNSEGAFDVIVVDADMVVDGWLGGDRLNKTNTFCLLDGTYSNQLS